jgi:hypothetical protein
MMSLYSQMRKRMRDRGVFRYWNMTAWTEDDLPLWKGRCKDVQQSSPASFQAIPGGTADPRFRFMARKSLVSYIGYFFPFFLPSVKDKIKWIFYGIFSYM